MEVIGLVGKNYGSSGGSGGGSIDQSVIDQINNNTSAITKLAQKGASLNLTVTPNKTVFFIGDNVETTLTATFSSDILTPGELTIVDSNSQSLIENKNSKSVSVAINITNITGKKTYKAIAVIGDWKLEKRIDITAYNAIYYGMISGDFDFRKLTKLTTPKSSAKSLQFEATAPGEQSKFYILVPSDVTKPTGFTSEKVPVYFEEETYTNGNITYSKYKVGGEYSQGTILTIDT